MVDSKNMIFTDDSNQRVLMSEDFNFAFDKHSGISLCWGKTINDSPEFDPICPQELIFKIGSKFILEEYLEDFNFLANIKIKIAETEFKNIDNAVAALAADNLTCLSTLASVVLIIDNISELQINDILSFKNYIDKFSIPVIVQINSDELISLADLTKLKLISTSVQLRTSNFNPEIFNKNINNLTNNDVRISIKLDITKDNWKDVYNNIPSIDSNISIKLYFIAPYASVIGYTKIQNKFEENKFENVRIATCSHNRFNKNKARITLAPMDCEASRYSVYVENRTVYPCEYNKQFGIELETCKTIPDFWEHKKMIKFRKQIIENNFCKL